LNGEPSHGAKAVANMRRPMIPPRRARSNRHAADRHCRPAVDAGDGGEGERHAALVVENMAMRMRLALRRLRLDGAR